MSAAKVLPVWRFRTPHYSHSQCEMRSSNQSHTRSISCWCPYAKVRSPGGIESCGLRNWNSKLEPAAPAQPYRIIPVNIGKGEQFKPGFLAVSPNNRIPAIVDNAPADGGQPIALFE